MIVERFTTPVLREQLDAYPAAALLGPTQAGKTTLARSLSRAYFDLEQSADRLRLDALWPSRVEGSDELIIF